MAMVKSRRILCFSFVLFVLFWNCCVCSSKTFKIAFLVPGPSSNYHINSDTSVDGLKLALRSVWKNPNILNGHKIAVKFFDTKCNTQSAVTSAMLARTSFGPDVIVGPPCQEGLKMVAQLGTYWNLPILNWYYTGNEFNNVKTYPTLVRMIPPVHLLSKSLVHILAEKNISHISVLFTGRTPFELLEDPVRADAASAGVEIHGVYKVTSNMSQVALKQMFDYIKRRASAVVMVCPFEDVRRYVLTAATEGMANGNYAFIHLDPQIYTNSEIATKVLSDGGWKRGDMLDRPARKAYESVIHVIPDPMIERPGQHSPFPRSNHRQYSRLTTQDAKMMLREWSLPIGSKPDVYSAYLCDAVVVWSVLVDMLHKQGKDYTDGKLMADYMRRVAADGATGHIALSENLDRLGEVYILDMQPDGNFKPTRFLKFNKTDGYTVTRFDPVNHLLAKDTRTIQHKKLPIRPGQSRITETTTATTSTSSHTTRAKTPLQVLTTQATTRLPVKTTTPPTTTTPVSVQTTTTPLPIQTETTHVPVKTTTTPLPVQTTTPLQVQITTTTLSDKKTKSTTSLPVRTTTVNNMSIIMARLFAIEAAMKMKNNEMKKTTRRRQTTQSPVNTIAANTKHRPTQKVDPHLDNFEVRRKKKRTIYVKAQKILDQIGQTEDPNVAAFLRLALERLNTEEDLVSAKQHRKILRATNNRKTTTATSLVTVPISTSSITQPSTTTTTAAPRQTTTTVQPTTYALTTTPQVSMKARQNTSPALTTAYYFYDETTTEPTTTTQKPKAKMIRRKGNGKISKPRRRLRQRWLSATPLPGTIRTTTDSPEAPDMDMILAENMISSIVDKVANQLIEPVTGEIKSLKKSINSMQSSITDDAKVVPLTTKVPKKSKPQIKPDINRSFIDEISSNVLTKLHGVSWLEQKPVETKNNVNTKGPSVFNRQQSNNYPKAALPVKTPRPTTQLPPMRIKPTPKSPTAPKIIGSWMSGLPPSLSMQLFAVETSPMKKEKLHNKPPRRFTVQAPVKKEKIKTTILPTRNYPFQRAKITPEIQGLFGGVTKPVEIPVRTDHLFIGRTAIDLPLQPSNAVHIQRHAVHNDAQAAVKKEHLYAGNTQINVSPIRSHVVSSRNHPKRNEVQQASSYQMTNQRVQPANLNVDSIIAKITNSVLSEMNKKIDSLQHSVRKTITTTETPTLRQTILRPMSPDAVAGGNNVSPISKEMVIKQISDAVIMQLSGRVNAHVEKTTLPPYTTVQNKEHEPESKKNSGESKTKSGNANAGTNDALVDAISSKVFGKMNAKLDALSNSVNTLQRNLGQQELEEIPPEMFGGGRRNQAMVGQEQMMQNYRQMQMAEMPKMPPMYGMPFPMMNQPQSLRNAFNTNNNGVNSNMAAVTEAPTTKATQKPVTVKLNTNNGMPWMPPMNQFPPMGMPNQLSMWGGGAGRGEGGSSQWWI